MKSKKDRLNQELERLSGKILERGLLFGTIDYGQIGSLSLEFDNEKKVINICVYIDDREVPLSDNEISSIIGVVEKYIDLKKIDDNIYMNFVGGKIKFNLTPILNF